MGIATIGAKTSGHGGFHPTVVTSGSSDVFCNGNGIEECNICNGKGVARIGDTVATHTNGKSSHSSVIARGASNVYVNGRPMARIGDHTTCGDTIIEGSSDSFADE